VVGRLYLGSDKRSAFSYDERWLRDSRFCTLSPDLLPVLSVQHPQEIFFRALEEHISMCRRWWSLINLTG